MGPAPCPGRVSSVPDRGEPRPGDLDDVGRVAVLDEKLEVDRAAAEVEEDEDEERDVAELDRLVEERDELRGRLRLQLVVREEEHLWRCRGRGAG